MNHSKILAEFEEGLVTEGTVCTREYAKRFLITKLDSAYAEGVKDGEGTKNGVERYQLGYRDALKKVLESLPEDIDIFSDESRLNGNWENKGWNDYRLAAGEIIQGLVKD